MNKIDSWLVNYSNYWKSQNIDGVMSLFSDDVKYGSFWEIHKNITSVRKEWESIKKQKNIDIKCDVYSKLDDKYIIMWELKYINLENSIVHLKGIYMIRLNTSGKCIEFIHCGE